MCPPTPLIEGTLNGLELPFQQAEGIASRHGVLVYTGTGDNPVVIKESQIIKDVKVSGLPKGSRIYGLALDAGADVTLDKDFSLTAAFDADKTNNQLRGIRNNQSSKLAIDGKTLIDLTMTNPGASAYITGMDTWGGTTTFNDAATVNVKVAKTPETKSANNLWANALQVADGATVGFTKGNVALNVINDFYTGQVVSFAGSGENHLVFGATDETAGDVTMTSASAYGVNIAGGMNGEIRFENAGKTAITAVVTDDGIAKSNAVGLMNGNTVVKSAEFDLRIFGNGVDNGSAGYANGTRGIWNLNNFTTAAPIFKVGMTAGQDYKAVANGVTYETTFDEEAARALGSRYAVTTGILNSGKFTATEASNVTVSANDGYWNAVAVNNDGRDIDISGTKNDNSLYLDASFIAQGDVTLEAVGRAAEDNRSLVLNQHFPTVLRVGETAALRNVAGYGEIGSAVAKLGSAGKTVSLSATTLAPTDTVGKTYNKVKTAALWAKGSTTELLGDTNILEANAESGEAFGIYADNAKVSIKGETLDILTSAASGKKYFGISAEKGSVVDLGAKTVTIATEGTKSADGTWGYGVDVKEESTLNFTGENVRVDTFNLPYTAQTVTVRGDSTINFANTGNTTIEARGPYGATGIVVKTNGGKKRDGLLNIDNTGIFEINAGYWDSDKKAYDASGVLKTNAVGLMVEAGDVTVSDRVTAMNVNIKGQGIDHNGTSYSDGTVGIFLQKVSTELPTSIKVNAKALNVDVQAAAAALTPEEAQAAKKGLDAFGIRGYDGLFRTSAATVTTVNVEESRGEAQGIYFNSKDRAETDRDNWTAGEFLGNTTVTATGNTGATALFVKDGADVTMGSDGTVTSLTATATTSDAATAVFVGERSSVTLKGKTTLTAAHALKGTGDVTLSGDLILNGKVTGFTGAFNQTAGLVVLNDATGRFGGTATITGGTFDVTGLTLDEGTTLDGVTINGGALKGTTAQFFANPLAGATDEELLKVTDAGAFNANDLTLTTGTLQMADAKFTLDYAGSASESFTTALGADNKQLVFTGTLVQAPQTLPEPGAKPEGVTDDNKIDVESAGNIEGNTVFTEVTLDTTSGEAAKNNLVIGSATAGGTSSAETNEVNANLGVKDVTLTAESTGVTVNNNRALTLVGGGEADELIKGGTDHLTLTVGSAGSMGVVQLGVDADTTQGGVLKTAVNVTGTSQLNVVKGEFAITGETTLDADSTLTVTKGAKLTLDKLGTGAGGLIAVGNEGSAGHAVIHESLGGHRIFLDPAFVPGVGIEGASKLVYSNATVNDQILVGQNSYAIFGDVGDEAAFLNTFAETGYAWGTGDITAAVYLAGQRAFTAGGLTVDGSKTAWDTVATDSVTFADGSLLVADVSALGSNPLITAGTITVDPGSKAVLTQVTAGSEYTLVSTGTGWAASQVKAANAMFEASAGTGDGKVQFAIRDAGAVYGNAMQGGALANAALSKAQTAAEYKFADALLSDVTGNKAAAAARFDAHMNPAGALALYETALDRASATRAVVREHNLASDALWVDISSGKTEVDGLSTGAQALDVETDYTGVTVGGDIAANGFGWGFALTAGSGDTDNDTFAGKNDFDVFGATLYGRMVAGGITFTGDAGVTFVDSDLEVGGPAGKSLAKVDTTIYSLGLEAKKDFAWQHAVLTPFAALDVYHLRADGFTTDRGVEVKKADATFVEMPIGVRASGEFKLKDGYLKPAASLAVIPTLAGDDIDVTTRFAGAASDYNFTATDGVRAKADLGVDFGNDKMALGLKAGYAWGDEERSGFDGRVNLKFFF